MEIFEIEIFQKDIYVILINHDKMASFHRFKFVETFLIPGQKKSTENTKIMLSIGMSTSYLISNNNRFFIFSFLLWSQINLLITHFVQIRNILKSGNPNIFDLYNCKIACIFSETSFYWNFHNFLPKDVNEKHNNNALYQRIYFISNTNHRFFVFLFLFSTMKQINLLITHFVQV